MVHFSAKENAAPQPPARGNSAVFNPPNLALEINSLFGPLMSNLAEIKMISLKTLKPGAAQNLNTSYKPRIIIIGEESSGKSSVVERLAMHSLFPRGERMTTRMPIKLRLLKKSETDPGWPQMPGPPPVHGRGRREPAVPL